MPWMSKQLSLKCTLRYDCMTRMMCLEQTTVRLVGRFSTGTTPHIYSKIQKQGSIRACKSIVLQVAQKTKMNLWIGIFLWIPCRALQRPKILVSPERLWLRIYAFEYLLVGAMIEYYWHDPPCIDLLYFDSSPHNTSYSNINNDCESVRRIRLNMGHASLVKHRHFRGHCHPKVWLRTWL